MKDTAPSSPTTCKREDHKTKLELIYTREMYYLYKISVWSGKESALKILKTWPTYINGKGTFDNARINRYHIPNLHLVRT